VTQDGAVAKRDDRTLSIARTWALPAALAAPLGIIAHEGAHVAAGALLGVPALRMHHLSVGYARVPAWQESRILLAGPVVTLLLVLGSCALVRSKGPKPSSLALGFAVGIRPALIGMGYLIDRLLQPWMASPPWSGDELAAAATLQISPDVVVAVLTLPLVAMWTYLFRASIQIDRPKALIWLSGGATAGLGFYALLLGPRMFP
jgi:hypothetical protein